MSDRLLVATRKGLFRLERGASGWRIAGADFIGDRVCVTGSDADGRTLWAAMDLGHYGAKIRRSDDGGQTWADVEAPKYPERPADSDDVDPMRKTPIPYNTELIWSLEAGKTAGRLWCGTIPGGLFRSDDGGESWSLVESLWNDPGRRRWFGGGYDYAGIHSICVDPRDDDRVAVAVSCGGVWSTRDGGASWRCQGDGMFATFMPPELRDDPGIQDPHRMVRCAAAPDCLWVQHHNGVFKTTNDCQKWVEVKMQPSSFGFAVAVHPDDPQTAWFAPAKADETRVPVDACVVVTRTCDGGESFDVLRNGLPDEHAYDLVYRHALDVAGDGKTLAMGSTTGSLWVTEDAGDHWTAINEHLPPIHAVRFL